MNENRITGACKDLWGRGFGRWFLVEVIGLNQSAAWVEISVSKKPQGRATWDSFRDMDVGANCCCTVLHFNYFGGVRALRKQLG